MKLPQLVSDEQRAILIKLKHKERSRNLVIGALLILVGILLPEFTPHLLHDVCGDTIKSVGFVPILKLVEDFL